MLSYFHIHFVSDKQEREKEYGLNHRKNMLRANFIHAVNLKYETTFWLFVNANVELKKAICSMHHRLDLKMKEYTQILWNGFDDKKKLWIYCQKYHAQTRAIVLGFKSSICCRNNDDDDDDDDNDDVDIINRIPIQFMK